MHDELGLERIDFFSDAIFAIAIALLALAICLPEWAVDEGIGQLLNELLAPRPSYFSYFTSFVTIGCSFPS